MSNSTTNIKLPEEADFSTAKREITQTADEIFMRITYSCGLVIETKQYAEKVDFRTNWKLAILPDGLIKIERP